MQERIGRTLFKTAAEETQIRISEVGLECDVNYLTGNEVVLASGARVDKIIFG